jgi:hypothetical protein
MAMDLGRRRGLVATLSKWPSVKRLEGTPFLEPRRRFCWAGARTRTLANFVRTARPSCSATLGRIFDLVTISVSKN